MNSRIDWIPRLDSDGNGMAEAIDPTKLGAASLLTIPTKPGKQRLVHKFDKLGMQVCRTDAAIKTMVRMFHRRWQDVDGYDKLPVASPAEHGKWGMSPGLKIPQVVFDAATDFVTSGLKKFLGPAEDVERGMEDPFLFVPREGSPAIIPSRRTLNPGERSLAYKVRQPVGQAQWLEANAVRGLQRANYNVEEKEHRAHFYGIAWGYNLPETWEAEVLGEDILGDRERSANYALDLFRENVSGWGNVDRKIQGAYTVDGALRLLGGQQFSSNNVTATQMIQRIMTWEQAYKRANGNRKPLGAIIAESERIALQTTYFGDNGNGPSVWDRCIGTRGENALFPWLNNAYWDERLNKANPDGTAARWVLYGGSEKETFIEHTESMLFGPFQEYMELTFIILRRIAGVVAKLPERFEYVDMAA